MLAAYDKQCQLLIFFFSLWKIKEYEGIFWWYIETKGKENPLNFWHYNLTFIVNACFTKDSKFHK